MVTRDGKVYEDVKVLKVSDTEVRVSHRSGMAAVKLSNLPQEWLIKFGKDGKVNPAAEQAEEKMRSEESAAIREQARKAEEAKAEARERVANNAARALAAAAADQERARVQTQSQSIRQAVSALPMVMNPVTGQPYPMSVQRQLLTEQNRQLSQRDTQREIARQMLGLPPKVAANSPEAVFESFIDGDFEGYEHERVFTLLNGQVWEQTEVKFNVHYSYGPRVLIYSVDGGGFKMLVNGMKEAVKVRLIR